MPLWHIGEPRWYNTVLMDCVDRIIYGRLETGLCCQVEDMIDVFKDRSDGIIVSNVFNTNLDVSVPVEPVIVGTLIIDSNYFMTLTQQVITKVGTDESTSTSYDTSCHILTRSPRIWFFSFVDE